MQYALIIIMFGELGPHRGYIWAYYTCSKWIAWFRDAICAYYNNVSCLPWANSRAFWAARKKPEKSPLKDATISRNLTYVLFGGRADPRRKLKKPKHSTTKKKKPYKCKVSCMFCSLRETDFSKKIFWSNALTLFYPKKSRNLTYVMFFSILGPLRTAPKRPKTLHM